MTNNWTLATFLASFQQEKTGEKRKRSKDDNVQPSGATATKKDKYEILPLHLRPRKLNFWDQRPEGAGYGTMTADQVKATGMFLLPSHLLKGTGSFSQPSMMLPAHQYGAVTQHSHNHNGAGGFNTCKIFVQGFAFAKEQELKDWFVDEFVKKKLVGWDQDDLIQKVLVHDQGFAYIDFKTPAQATSCLVLSQALFKDSPLTITRTKDYSPDPTVYTPGVISPVVMDTPHKLFIGGLPQYVNDEQVLELLKAFGELRSFNLVKNSEGISKGFAFCEYLDPEITDLAATGLNGLELGDKKMIVQRAHVGTSSKLPMIEGALPGAGLGRAVLPIEILGAGGLKPAEPTRVLMLLNLMDKVELTNKVKISEDDEGNVIRSEGGEGDEMRIRVEIDVRLECERFGSVEDVVIPQPGKEKEVVSGVGRAYIKFNDIESCGKAQRALAGRKFNGRTVLTTFCNEGKFDSRQF